MDSKVIPTPTQNKIFRIFFCFSLSFFEPIKVEPEMLAPSNAATPVAHGAQKFSFVDIYLRLKKPKNP